MSFNRHQEGWQSFCHSLPVCHSYWCSFQNWLKTFTRRGEQHLNLLKISCVNINPIKFCVKSFAVTDQHEFAWQMFIHLFSCHGCWYSIQWVNSKHVTFQLFYTQRWDIHFFFIIITNLSQNVTHCGEFYQKIYLSHHFSHWQSHLMLIQHPWNQIVHLFFRFCWDPLLMALSQV